MAEDHPPARDDKRSFEKDPYCESSLGAWFPPHWPSERAYTEDDIQDITTTLHRTGGRLWSQAPRLYTVLRLIDRLQKLEEIMKAGVTDLWCPFAARCLPELLDGEELKLSFPRQQDKVMTGATGLDNEPGRHMHFAIPDRADSCFMVLGHLGRGSTGHVERIGLRIPESNAAILDMSSSTTVVQQIDATGYSNDEGKSQASHKGRARKFIRRGQMFRKNQATLRGFERTLRVFKTVSHAHIVQF